MSMYVAKAVIADFILVFHCLSEILNKIIR